MRQLLSTALVAVIVGALAGVTAGAFAQAEPGSAVEPAARVRNADRVDGKHAVSYTNKRGVRAGKLVATNRQGLLPSNIVQPYWGYIKNKPGILADHQIAWNEVADKPGILADGRIGWGEVVGKPAVLADDQVAWGEVVGKPAGFEDGVDNAGVTGVKVRKVLAINDLPLNSAGSSNYALMISSACGSSEVLLHAGFDATPNGALTIRESFSTNARSWTWVVEKAAVAATVDIWVTCLRVTPDDALTSAKLTPSSSGAKVTKGR